MVEKTMDKIVALAKQEDLYIRDLSLRWACKYMGLW